MWLILLQFCLISASNSLVQKNFAKKLINPETITSLKTLSSKPTDKLTCSALCLKEHGEDCLAFKVDKDQGCWLVENPDDMKEVAPSCKYETPPTPIWSTIPSSKSYLALSKSLVHYSTFSYT